MLARNLINLNSKLLVRSVNSLGMTTIAFPTTSIKSYNDIPGPKTLPVVGSLFNIKSFGGDYDFMEFRDFQDHLQANFGDLVKWEIFNYKFVYVFKPEHIKEVYNADNSTPFRPAADPMVKLHEKIGLKLDLINSQGERWRKLRSLANPVMARPQTIHSYLKNHNKIANDLIDVIDEKFKAGENHLEFSNFEQILRLLTLEYVSELAFDHRIKCVNEKFRECNSVSDMVNAIEEFFVRLGRLSFSFPFWRIFPTSDWRKFEKAGTFIYSMVRKFIKNAQFSESESESKKSILGEFLARKEKYGLELEDVVAIMTDFLVAGVDTTSNSLYYLLYELGMNPHIQSRLFNEIQTVIGDDKEVTSDHIEKMKYLKCVFKESMRLHSTVPANARILSQDITIDNYQIPKDTIMLFANSHITRSERYFKNAKVFDPSRWESSSGQCMHPYAALPFGHGVRMCIGRRVAEQEIYLTLIKLVQAFRIEFVGAETPSLKVGLVAAPDKPLDIKFYKRNENFCNFVN